MLRHTMMFAVMIAFSSTLFAESAMHRYRVTEHFEIARDHVKLWVPLPLESDYQSVSDMRLEGNYRLYEEHRDARYGARMLYLDFDPAGKVAEATLSYTVEVQDRHTDFDASSESRLDDAERAVYLGATDHVRIDGVVKRYADEITAGASSDLEKARRIYDWTWKNMFRDPKTRGCGLGDAYHSLESGYLGGKCADVSAVFVALLRAAGIPAREVFGIRAAPSRYSKAYGTKSEDITTAQHCRSEFYIDGYGWVPADPADVTKLLLVENLKRDDAKVIAEAARQFGNWEMNWFAYNSARDFMLTPRPEQYPLSIFSYPYAESGDEPLDYYDPKTFRYTITVTPLP